MPHTWIGVSYRLLVTGDRPQAIMELPPAFAQELVPLTLCKGAVSHKAMERIIGRCGRVAHVIPEARPFVGAFYAAMRASKQAAAEGRREAPPGNTLPDASPQLRAGSTPSPPPQQMP